MLRNYPRLRRWEDTGDVFQTAVIRLYQSLTKVRPESVQDYFGLAATQVRRTLIDLARHHYGPLGQATRHYSDPATSLRPPVVEQQAASVDQPETLDAWARFHGAVDSLPENERKVFELYWYGGLPSAEIAELLGVSVPTVKRRLRSARISLAEALRRFDFGSQHDRTTTDDR
jgi:RNA polymerase sigma-70 factor (ECF subfamily)